MKKLHTILLITIMSSLSLTAQNNATKKADKHFSKFQFIDAAEDYMSLVNNGKADEYVYRQLAECYYNVFNTVEAEKWFEKALETSAEPELIYKLAQMQKANGKYAESNANMKKFARMRPADNRSIAFNKNPDYLPKLLEKGKKFNVQNMSINSEAADFGGTINEGAIYITSARDGSRTYGWNKEPFLDIYVATANADGSYQEPVVLGENINTKYHEGVVSFSPDGKTMYYSRESFYEKKYEKDSLTNNKYSVLNLYKSVKIGDVWTAAEPLNINSNNFSVKNPSISLDGSTIYFASDMPGGFGNFDIYKASILDDGSIGEAENLGQKVNTEGQEMFPYISSNGTLYFSSDGHLGLGGLDVFYTKEIDGKMAPIRNVGMPVSSSADDFAFSINEESEMGFVSSNRDGGKGSDDVYAIKKLQPLCDVLISTVITDAETNAPLAGAYVSLFDKDENIITSKTTDANGLVEFMVECEDVNIITATANDYESAKVTTIPTSEEETQVDIALDPIEEIIVANLVELNPIYFDFDKSNITAKAAFELDKLVQVMNKYPQISISAESHTDSRGSATYNESLSERRAKTTVQYVISKGIDADRISGVGKGENSPKVDCSKGCSEEEHQLNRRSEFIIIEGNPNE
jgi:outer membrane protein OmpA-like peptidoglycan-associated protein/tetratricopeptide (TPR) repeat protein